MFRGYLVVPHGPERGQGSTVTCVVNADPLLSTEDSPAWTDDTDREAAEGIMHCLWQEAEYALEHQGPSLLETVTMTQQANLTGTWKLTKNEHYQEFLATTGASWMERKAADAAPATHVITHVPGESLKLDIRALLSQSITYGFDQEPVFMEIKGNRFEDVATETALGVTVRKFHRVKNYEILASRELQPGGNSLCLNLTCNFLDGSGTTDWAKQWFERQDQ